MCGIVYSTWCVFCANDNDICVLLLNVLIVELTSRSVLVVLVCVRWFLLRDITSVARCSLLHTSLSHTLGVVKENI